MKDINRIEIRGYIGTIRILELQGTRCATFSVCTNKYIKKENTFCESTWHIVNAYEGQQTDPAIFTAAKNTYVHLKGYVRQTRYTDSTGAERIMQEVVAERLKCLPRELNMEDEKPEWKFAYDEEIFDQLGENFVGVITNGESFLFFHILKTEEGKPETCHIYSSIMNMYTNCPEVSFVWTEQNGQMMLDALNSLETEEDSRYCGENNILYEVKFNPA